MGVELPFRLDAGHAVTGEQGRKGAVDELDALLELCLLMLLGGIQRPLEVVEDRNQLADQPLVCQGDVLRPLPGRALFVVVEVGGESQQPVVYLRFRLLLLCRRLLLLDLLLVHEVGASSSTTSYSPSSTTSSPDSEGSPLPPPPADACACCAASA